MSLTNEVAEMLLTPVVVAAGVVFVVKVIVKRYVDDVMKLQNTKALEYQKKLGEINASLENISELTRLVEDVKAGFERNKITYQIQFAKINERRIDILEELYKKLFRLQQATQTITAFMHPVIKDADAENKARLDEVSEAYDDFRNYFPPKMLFFKTEFNEMLAAIVKLFWDVLWDSTELARMKGREIPKEYYKESLEKIKAARERFEKEIPEALNRLDLECKRLIGIIEHGAEEEIK